MNSTGPGRPYRLILISGSIAAGKSTLAAGVTDRLRASGASVALVGLDEVAAMALPTLPDWDWAHESHARLVAAWLDTPVDVVVAEGTGTPAEVERLFARVPTETPTLHVLLQAGYEAALRRALGEPSRGLSKDPVFLRRAYDQFVAGLPGLRPDLRLDADTRTPGELVGAVLQAIGR